MDQPVDLLGCQLLHGRVDADRGVINPGVDPAEVVDRHVGEALHLRPIGDVGRHHHSAATEALDLSCHLLQSCLVTGGEDNRGPDAPEAKCCLPSDTRRGASNDDNLFLYRTCHDAPPACGPGPSSGGRCAGSKPTPRPLKCPSLHWQWDSWQGDRLEFVLLERYAGRAPTWPSR